MLVNGLDERRCGGVEADDATMLVHTDASGPLDSEHSILSV